ncbi:MAG: LysR family transcriptional regulator [Pseudobutyrivibrio sp.]|nr:LysR family transcriptional regulator [Pseudobutyrivibrio sp.]
MNTRNFKCFQTVYEERNLQAAASKLFLSPQGLSKIIKSLEEECGAPLFVRTKEGFIPTESGKVFYEKSKVVTKDLNEMFSSIEALNDKEKRFKIGFAAGTIRAIDIALVREYMENNPEILASWHEQENSRVLKQVINDEIGFGFVIGKPAETNIKAVKLKSIDVVLYVYNGHRLWNESEVELLDIKNEPIISMNEKYHIYQDVINACRMNGFNPDIVAKVSEGQSIYQLVKNKIGIGVAPRFFGDTDQVKAVAIRDAYAWDIYGIYRGDTVDIDLVERLIAKFGERE